MAGASRRDSVRLGFTRLGFTRLGFTRLGFARLGVVQSGSPARSARRPHSARQLAPSAAPGASMLPPSGGGLGSPSAKGTTRTLGPAQTLAPFTASPPPMLPRQPSAVGPQLPLALVARYGHELSAPITNGLLWRVFPARPDPTGTFRVLKEDRNATPVIMLPAGDYVVLVSFGMASAAKAVHLKEPTREPLSFPPAVSSSRAGSAMSKSPTARYPSNLQG